MNIKENNYKILEVGNDFVTYRHKHEATIWSIEEITKDELLECFGEHQRTAYWGEGDSCTDIEPTYSELAELNQDEIQEFIKCFHHSRAVNRDEDYESPSTGLESLIIALRDAQTVTARETLCQKILIELRESLANLPNNTVQCFSSDFR